MAAVAVIAAIGLAIFFLRNGDQQMFGRDILVLHLFGLLLRGGKKLV